MNKTIFDKHCILHTTSEFIFSCLTVFDNPVEGWKADIIIANKSGFISTSISCNLSTDMFRNIIFFVQTLKNKFLKENGLLSRSFRVKHAFYFKPDITRGGTPFYLFKFRSTFGKDNIELHFHVISDPCLKFLPKIIVATTRFGCGLAFCVHPSIVLDQ